MSNNRHLHFAKTIPFPGLLMMTWGEGDSKSAIFAETFVNGALQKLITEQFFLERAVLQSMSCLRERRVFSS